MTESGSKIDATLGLPPQNPRRTRDLLPPRLLSGQIELRES
jgi:hypothetical protein